LGSALINKSADIAHRRIEGNGLLGGSINEQGYLRGLNDSVNFASIGMVPVTGSGLKGNGGFKYAHGRGLDGRGIYGDGLGMLLASASALAGKGLSGKGLSGKGRFVKGSQEAKDYMASLRAKRMKK
jgi:hypothetical protein